MFVDWCASSMHIIIYVYRPVPDYSKTKRVCITVGLYTLRYQTLVRLEKLTYLRDSIGMFDYTWRAPEINFLGFPFLHVQTRFLIPWHTLIQKVDEGSASVMWSHHLISNTNYTVAQLSRTQHPRIYNNAKTLWGSLPSVMTPCHC